MTYQVKFILDSEGKYCFGNISACDVLLIDHKTGKTFFRDIYTNKKKFRKIYIKSKKSILQKQNVPIIKHI